MVRRLFQRLADVMAAVAFAEEGEPETARQLLAEVDADAPPRPDEERAPLLRPPHPPLAKSS